MCQCVCVRVWVGVWVCACVGTTKIWPILAVSTSRGQAGNGGGLSWWESEESDLRASPGPAWSAQCPVLNLSPPGEARGPRPKLAENKLSAKQSEPIGCSQSLVPNHPPHLLETILTFPCQLACCHLLAWLHSAATQGFTLLFPQLWSR